jgi:hypothetical protein
MTELIGQTLGQYRILEQIGQGGMATVYKAYQPALDRYVAVKVLPPYFAHEPGFAMRFTREAKAIAKLNHPNILPIHDFGQEGDLNYIVMKYVEAGTLKDRLGEPLPLGEAVDIVGQIAAALDHAHQRGILHRDVKPSNVLLDEGRWILLTDFGLAKMVEGSAVLTASGVGVGTPAYMAPEQGQGEAVDARADIYSLGIVLYEILTGRVPYEAETPMAVVIKHITEPLPLPRSINPAIPEAVERVILKALAKEPGDRFASAVEMVEALKAVVATAPEAMPEAAAVPAVEPPLPTPSPPETPAEPTPTIAEGPVQPRRAMPWKLIGVLAGIVLLAVLAVVILGSLADKGTVQETPTVAVLATATATEQAATATRLAPTHTSAPPSPTPDYSTAGEVAIALGEANEEHGLVQFDLEGGDGITAPADVGGRAARVTMPNGTPARYIYFDVADSFLFAQDAYLRVSVEYFDQGDFTFDLSYDSTDARADAQGRYKLTALAIHLGNSGQWKTATFELPDAFFGGRQHQGADFRIGTSDNELFVHTVTVTKLELPPVVGPEPSDRVATFYYPWYGNPTVDGEWVHWEGPDFQPPLDISSDYYPVLGAYSSVDPSAVAQHFAWLREAGVGVVVSSWWGQDSLEDRAVPVLLELGEQYGIKVAFHIEPYRGRTAERLVDDIRYLYARYGEHPAFYRTPAPTRWSPDDRMKGLFFLWSVHYAGDDSQEVEADYWREAMDEVHALPDGSLVIACTIQSDWVDGGHFDGLYNYTALHLDEEGGFSWARGLPLDAWYVPSVLPGFSARRIDYPADTFVPRQDGVTYEEQWEAALAVGVEPALVTITSFNEWHEGTQIEPAAAEATNGLGHTYSDYSPLPPEGYLALTRQWVDRFLAMTWPRTYRVRFRMTTTSDWTTFGLIGGAAWIRPGLVFMSEEAGYAWVEGDRLLLEQPIAQAEEGRAVEVIVDILLVHAEGEERLGFEIERGHLGATEVELANYLRAEPVAVATFEWGEIHSDPRNAQVFWIPATDLLNPKP